MLFGKLPAHGDFVARGLGDSEAGALDDWLSASLSDAATMEDFDSLYTQAPAWRFIATISRMAMCGVIAPSLDSVGRQFPILAGVAAGENTGMLIDAVEAHLYDAFANGQTADALFAALSTFPGLPEEAVVLSPTGWFLENADKVVVDRLDGERPPDLLRHMVEAGRS